MHFGIAEPRSWQSAMVGWLEHGAGTIAPKTLKRYGSSLEAATRLSLDSKMLAEIDADLLRELERARRRQGVTNATIRRDLTAMSAVLEHAIAEGWLETNPTLAFRSRRSLAERRDPILLPEAESITAMLAKSPSRFADAQKFALETGMRQEEIFGLRHSQLDSSNGAITIVGKRRKLRVIPYTARAQQIVERQPRFLRSEIVFWHDAGERWSSPGSRFTDIRRSVARKAAQEKWAFVPYRFHDLRHLFAVEFLRLGKGSIYDLQNLLGHESIKTTEGYLAFLTPDQKRIAMQQVAQIGAQQRRSEGGN